jgi:electron transfer flavoprotein alpha subunit
VQPTGPFVATLQPGVRTVEVGTGRADVTSLDVEIVVRPDAEVVDVLPPDAATMDLSEAPRIVGVGAGLMAGEPDEVRTRFETVVGVGEAIGASMGATRVVTDAGWIGHARQIGTTGVVVDPRLYLAFAISGAVQHTAGLGHPDHIISVNVDPHCPMMAMADLAVVADANATLDALADRLGVSHSATQGAAEVAHG